MKHINNIDIDQIKLSFNDPKKPFRYTTIDNFFNKESCDRFSKSYPDSNDNRWYRFRDTFHGEDNVFEKV